MMHLKYYKLKKKIGKFKTLKFFLLTIQQRPEEITF